MRWIFGARKRSAGRVAARRNQLGLGSFAGRPRRLAHEFLEDRRMLAVFVVTGTGDADLAGSPTANPVAGQTDTYDLPSLRAAVDAVNGLGGDNTIQFAPSLSGITLSNGQLELSDLTGTTTIAGPGASQLTVSGNYTTTVFQVDGGVTANISGLTIADGYAEYGYGGGVYNAGTLTLSNSILSGNSVAGAYGGGIYNDGTLTLGNSTLSENSNAGGYGGGICNDGGATITNSTLSENSAAGGDGGGIDNRGTLTLSNSTLSENSAYDGGGIGNDGTLTLSNSTLSGNTASYFGGGIDNGGIIDSTVTITNSTLSENSAAGGDGGGIYNRGTLTLSNSTLSENSAPGRGAGIANTGGSLTLDSTIVGGNTGASDIYQYYNFGVTTASYSLIQSYSLGSFPAGVGNIFNVSPLLGPLGYYGGTTETMPELPGSPAIGAGDNGPDAPTTDQRGVSRGGDADIGAFQSQGFTLTATSGGGQAAAMGAEFAQPLVVTVAANDPLEPVAGGLVTFTAPGDDPTALLAGSPATIAADGTASVTATASETAGNYSVTAASGTAGPASFPLTNANSLVVNTASDSVPGTPGPADPADGFPTLREAIEFADANAGYWLITFAPGLSGPITLSYGELELSEAQGQPNTIAIAGPGASQLTVSGNDASTVFQVDSGVTADISGLTIADGNANIYGDGGGISNFGTLTLSNSTISGSSAYLGGGVFNDGTATINSSTISGNSAGWQGSGIYTNGSLTLCNSTISGNTNTYYGGGIYNDGSATITNSTLSGNSASYGAGGGGIFNDSAGGLTVTSSTVSGNSAQGDGSGIYNQGTLTLDSTIVGGNTGYDDLAGQATANYSLIQSTDSQFSISGNLSTDIFGVSPLLGSLDNYGGTTETMPLLPGSPAIGAGDNGPDTPATDQRGVSRGGDADIGAFQSQGFTLAVTSGDGQSALLDSAFAQPLVVTVVANDPVEPVAGGRVTFTAPGSGTSASLAGSPATIAADDTASATATASDTAGSYSVTAAAIGAAGQASFSLTNTNILVVNTASDPASPVPGELSLREAIDYTDANQGAFTITFDPTLSGDTIRLANGELELSNTSGTTTITGPGASLLTVSGDNASTVFQVDSGVTADISGLTIADGYAGDGGGIFNNGTLTLSNSTLSGNSAYSYGGGNGGGGIYNTGTLNLSNSTLSGNEAFSEYGNNDGGGIDNTGTLYLSDSTLSGNEAFSEYDIYRVYGGGIYNAGTLNISNSTLSENSANGYYDEGGGIYNSGGAVTITSSTVSGNSAHGGGSGIYNQGTLTLDSTIVGGNTGSNDLSGAATANYSLIQSTDSQSSISGNLSTDIFGVSPLLGPLGNYGGTTETMPLLPGSPAIGAGDTATAPPTDQRGVSRGGQADIGAFQSQGFTLTATSGGGQSEVLGSAFAQPLVVTVTSAYGEPVVGGQVTFTAPSSGASALIVSTVTIASDGTASVTPTAYGATGTYSVTAAANGAAGQASFSLTNTDTLVVNTASDTASPVPGELSLREAIDYTDANQGAFTITFDPTLSGDTIRLANGELELSNTSGTTTITGPGASLLTVSGDNASTVFQVDSGVTADISGLTIADGYAGDGGGIFNNGTLTLSNSTLSGNSAYSYGGGNGGGGIYNTGTLNLSNSTLSGNEAFSEYGNNDGGGIYNTGTLNVTNSTLSGNSVDSLYDADGTIGGGIYNAGTLTISNSTLSGNRAYSNYHDYAAGGGIYNDGNGTLTITNSTFSGNSADSDGGGIYNAGAMALTSSTLSENSAANGGGVYNVNYAQSTITSSTLSGNSASGDGSGIYNYGTLTLDSTIVGENTGSNDLAGAATANYSLIESSDSQSSISGNLSTDTFGLSPLLGPLSNYGGPTDTLPLLPGSPAIGAGDTTNAPPTDQRGVSRGVQADIGAFQSQGFTLYYSSGNGQSAILGSAFAQPLVVTVVANASVEPVLGGQVTFTAPSSDPAAPPDSPSALIGAPATIVASGTPGVGTASVTPTAFGVGGNYSVTAAANGAAGSVSFDLTNTELTSLEVTTAADETSPSDTPLTLREAVAYADDHYSDNTITFAADLTGGQTITLALGELDLTNTTGTTTITGPGASLLTVNGHNASTVFAVESGVTADISGLTITDGNGSEGGGIDNNGGLTLSSSTLSGNSATFGGGIYNNGGGVFITNSTLSGNSANSGSGGGIYNSGGGVTITNSTLSGNSANSGSGGGIYNSRGGVVVINSTLSGNSADDGGGIDNANSEGALVVQGSTLSGNSAAGSGGGIYNGGNANIISSVLSGNSANSGSGGGIYSDSETSLEILNSTLSGNSADDGGGVDNNSNGPRSVVIVIGSTLSGNRASSEGGGILNYGAAQVNNSTFSDNSAGQGGGIYSALDNPYDQLAVNVSTFSGNSAAGSGGGIYVDSGPNGGPATIVVSTLSGNSAGDSGGGIYIDGGSNGGPVAIAVSTLSGNSAGGSGGGIYIDGGSIGGFVVIASSTLSGNLAGGSGGGIYHTGGNTQIPFTLQVVASTLAGNSAGIGGGGIYSGDGTLQVVASTLSGNSAEQGGGILSDAGDVASIVSSTLAGNFAVDGGGIDNAGMLTVTDSTLAGNSATLRGGGLANFGSATLANTLVAGDTAPFGPDVFGPVTASYSLIQGPSGFTLSAASGNNLLGVDPLLGPLGNYGGSTETVPLLPGSPAIDAGSYSLAVNPNGGQLTDDQRGVPLNGIVDIGAFEVDDDSFTLSGASGTYGGTATLTATLLVDNVPIAGQLITFSVPGQSLTLGTATTNSLGVATLSAASLVGLPANTVGYGAGAAVGPGPVEATGTLIVNPAPLSITANNASKRYGAADPHFSATITGFVSGDSLASLGGALTLTANELSGIGPSGNATVGTYPITPAGLTSTNYDITVTPGTLTVKPAPLTITTVPASKSYGAADPQFSVTGWGFAPNEGPANLVGTPTFSTNESSDLEPSGNAAVGVYQVTPAGLSSTNYTITFVPGTLTVNPALLVIAANPASKVYGSADPTFTWSTAGLATGETIKNNLQGTLSFSTSEQGSNASVGTYQVTPSGVSSPNYLILFLPGTLTVTAAAPIITWPTPAPITYPTALSITQLDASASWTVGGTPTSVTGTFAYGPPAGTVLGPGSRTLLTVFTPADTVDYTTARKSVTLTVDQAPQAPAITSANNATFEVGTAGTFTVTASGFPNSTLSETGVLPGGVTFTDNGNGTATLAGAPATASGGAYSFSITASNGASPNATQSFTLSVDQAPAITSANSATFKAGTTGTFTVTTSGFPKSTLSETGTLPGGVTFTNNGNGTATLAGTPAAASGGAYSFSIAASNGVTPNAAQSFTLTVDQAPAVTSANNATFKVGTAGTFTVTTSGFPKSTLSETGPLPLNVSFTNNGNGTATLAGAPATGTGGTHSITITASNGVSPNATQSFTLTIDQPPKITSTAGTTFTVGKSGSFTITTTPGVPATTTVSESGPLPSGVSFKAGSNGTATLSGTPAAGSGGVYNVTISAGNAPSSATTQPFTLTVDQAPAITSAAKATFTAGSAGSFTVATTGYPAATFSEIGKLPAGVAFVDNHNGTATLSGTPAASTGSTYSYIDIYASNGVLPEAVQFFTLTVGASSSVKAGVHLSNAATNDAAMMAVLADSSDDTTDTGTKKSLSVSDLALLDGV